MVDQDTTTDDPMTTDVASVVETATVPPTAPDPQPPQAPVPPPSVTAPIEEALRWLASVTTMAGPPDSVDVSTTTRRIDVAVADQMLFTRWQAIIGAVRQSTRHDALGSTVLAATVYPGLWMVTIHAHVRPTS
jgi:hypothetical protein